MSFLLPWLTLLSVARILGSDLSKIHTNKPLSALGMVNTFLRSISGDIDADINSYSGSHGARSLSRHAGLDKLAMEHCEYLRQHKGSFSLYGKNVSHIGSDARAVVAMRVYNMINCSENVAWTKTGPSQAATSQAVIKLWKDSAKHHESILDDQCTPTGVGAVVDADGSVFATQIFATKSNSLMSAQDRFNQF
jgi:uncharacterized protein YkwD